MNEWWWRRVVGWMGDKYTYLHTVWITAWKCICIGWQFAKVTLAAAAATTTKQNQSNKTINFTWFKKKNEQRDKWNDYYKGTFQRRWHFICDALSRSIHYRTPPPPLPLQPSFLHLCVHKSVHCLHICVYVRVSIVFV